MGQAKVRGTMEQRQAEAVERNRLAAQAKAEQDRAERQAWAEAQANAQAERERLNSERIARGEPQLVPTPRPPQRMGSRRSGLSTLLAVAALATLGSGR